jgi:pyrroline-5-carboxylate reductase
LIKLNKKIGLIGTGNIGTAIIKGITEHQKVSPDKIYIYDRNYSKLAYLEQSTGVKIAPDLTKLVTASDIIILAVKPHSIEETLRLIKPSYNTNKIIITLAVGVPLKFYANILGENSKIVRTMPNMPILVSEGMTLVSYNKNLDDAEIDEVKQLFKFVGQVEELDEKLMSHVTAITGSSPAYVFMFIEAMADAAVLLGIPRRISYKLASQAVLGSAKMVLETEFHPAQLKDQVCTPAGTTIEALRVLEKKGFRSLVIEAIKACSDKAIEIESNIGKKDC